MTQCYVEVRKTAARGTESVAADVMRHLHARQHLGKAVIVYDQSIGMLGAARKQWLKLARSLQKQRSSTLNADKILKYTHNITHMQRMWFTAKDPLESPEADVFFLRPDELEILPLSCLSVYILDPVDRETAGKILPQLPDGALVIDYEQSAYWEKDLGLKPKAFLEQRVTRAWRETQTFLEGCKIDIYELDVDEMQTIDAMDAALDTLLGISHQFLRVANEFQRALELARPMHTTKKERTAYDSLVLLAHRVQALATGTFAQNFLESYNEDDTFFLYYITEGLLSGDLSARYTKHISAGHVHLAQGLRRLAEAHGKAIASPMA